ncbi:MAG: RNase adapter RapZ [bacterium]
MRRKTAKATFYIITGLSGAGKTFANKCFEDMGYYCVDNLPPALIPNFAELCAHSTREITKAVLVLDIRGGRFFDDVFKALDVLDKEKYKYYILFLDASDEVLIRRYKETRRAHPLAGPDGSIQSGLDEERRKLRRIMERADYHVDTSRMTPWDLKRELLRTVLGEKDSGRLDVTIISFGYKYGIPLESDLVFDVRFLPNPFYQPELKNVGGGSKKVAGFVMRHRVSRSFMKRVSDLVLFSLSHAKEEGKENFVVSVGCTGGFHRSVVIADELKKVLSGNGYGVKVVHRDMRSGV